MSPSDITRLTQSITEHHRMDLFSLRSRRVSKHAYCAVDSTTRSAYGDSLADITDRGYESLKNIEQYILSDRKVLMSIKGRRTK